MHCLVLTDTKREKLTLSIKDGVILRVYNIHAMTYVVIPERKKHNFIWKL